MTHNSDILDRFLEFVNKKKLQLYSAQEEAILELFDGKNVILNTPTGSGKSLVATALHFKALAEGIRSVYTCPIKALVNEKFMALCRDFGPDNVGMMTGDATVNREAPILCCTAEILSNIALRQGADSGFQEVIMDEFHYYSDRERGVAWQVPLLTMSNSRFLLMSATLGDTTFFEQRLTELTGRKTVLVRSDERPVPLEFKYQEISLPRTIENLITENRVPVYVVGFTQKACAQEAQNLMSVEFCTKEEKKAIAGAIQDVKFSSPYGKEIQKFLRHGIGLHHAGLLPKYRILIERMAQRGFLKVICGTDTLGVGVNIPIRTVLFTKLCKFDGEKTAILSVRDFRQISGRAGRKGFDERGFVVVQAPEHVIENLRLEEKKGKFVKRKPPEKGYVHWDKETFNRLMTQPPELLVSRFKITHAMLLNVLSRETDGCKAMRALIRSCHEADSTKRKLLKTAFQLFRSLLERKIIEFIPKTEHGSHLRVNVDLQDDFSLNQTLSLYLIDTIKLLDPESSEYALNLLTLVESILENPDLILQRQLDRIKTEKMAQMKADGIEFDERIAELEKLEYPKPNREFIYGTFNDFSAAHPWVGIENIRPKSIAREMFETFQSFDEYIRDYDLHRGEGLLLRYLSDVYKVLVQTVPANVKNDELDSMILYFGSMVRDVDSSLLDEWEKMRGGVSQNLEKSTPPITTTQDSADITTDQRAFGILVRNEIFKFIRAISARNYQAASELFDPKADPNQIEEVLQEYFKDHQRICTDTRARAPKNTIIGSKDSEENRIRQILVDPEGHNDWAAEFELNIPLSRDQGRAVLTFIGISTI